MQTGMRWGVLPALNVYRAAGGAIGGIAGGVVFGALLALGGMMPDIARLVGSTSPLVGWLVHLLLSAAFGAVYAMVVLPVPPGRALAFAVAWAVALWLVAGTLVMRSTLGMPIRVDGALTLSLVGHLAWGLVLGIVYAGIPTRIGAPRSTPLQR